MPNRTRDLKVALANRPALTIRLRVHVRLDVRSSTPRAPRTHARTAARLGGRVPMTRVTAMAALDARERALAALLARAARLERAADGGGALRVGVRPHG